MNYNDIVARVRTTGKPIHIRYKQAKDKSMIQLRVAGAGVPSNDANASNGVMVNTDQPNKCIVVEPFGNLSKSKGAPELPLPKDGGSPSA